jgi:hypothetical protein
MEVWREEGTAIIIGQALTGAGATSHAATRDQIRTMNELACITIDPPATSA